jgi:hypothetical protein
LSKGSWEDKQADLAWYFDDPCVPVRPSDIGLYENAEGQEIITLDGFPIGAFVRDARP